MGIKVLIFEVESKPDDTEEAIHAAFRREERLRQPGEDVGSPPWAGSAHGHAIETFDPGIRP